MALPPISSIRPIAVPGVVQPGNRTAAGADPAGSQSFGNVLAQQLDKLNAVQAKADDLALQAATGDLKSIQDYTIAATEAQLLTQLTVAVRNKAVEAFNDIMRMQV
ncbi:MAG: flagellar hook-basal body complex protein FliE [Ilumatobacteraceae bacterium]